MTGSPVPARKHGVGPDEAKWDHAAAWVDRAAACADAGRLDEALALARRAATTLLRVVGESHPDHANARLTLGRVLVTRGRPRQALPHLARASAALLRAREPDETITALAIQTLLAHAHCLIDLGRFGDARARARKALQVARERLGDRAPETASAHNLLGMIGKFSGRFADAERHYAAALPIMEAHFGKVSREVATVLHNLGGLEHARGRFADGEPPARRAVEIARELMAPDDPELIAHEVAHAALLDGLERHAEAAEIYRRAARAFVAHYGREHYEVASTLHNLASAEHAMGNLAGARRHYEEALRLLEKLRGRRHPDYALTQYNLALLHRDEGRAKHARALLRRALATFRGRLGEAHPSTRACADALARLG